MPWKLKINKKLITQWHSEGEDPRTHNRTTHLSLDKERRDPSTTTEQEETNTEEKTELSS